MNPIDQIKQAQESLLTKILEVAANPRPSYSIEGQSVSHGDFLKTLMESLKTTQELLQMFEPYWHATVAV